MRKKLGYLCLALAVIVLAISGILYYKTFVSNNEKNDVQLSEDIATDQVVGDITEISVDSVKGITAEDAEKLCYLVMGEKDEETGFIFSFGTSGAVETNGKQYYVIRASWLVNNSHMSYIGDFFVSADGRELYTGTAIAGEYTMDDLIWKE